MATTTTTQTNDPFSRESSLVDPLLTAAQQKWKREAVWYFAYGSNLSAATMTKRGITPLAVRGVEVPSHYLTFDIFGIPFSEPCYASIAAFPALAGRDDDDDNDGERRPVDLYWRGRFLARVPPVQGVAYQLTPDDFLRLLTSEGGGVVYRSIECRGRFLAANAAGTARCEDEEQEEEGGEGVTVYTLQSKRPLRPSGCPSVRYMGLFRSGAAGMGLPAAYVAYLETIPAYARPTRAPWGSGIFTYFWRPVLRRVTGWTQWRNDAEGNCPWWVARLVVFLYEAMWTYHDAVHRRVFEGGDGGKLEFRVGGEGRAE